MIHSDKAQSAVDALNDLLADLDTRESPCSCCNRVRYENWDDARKAIEIRTMISKIRRMGRLR